MRKKIDSHNNRDSISADSESINKFQESIFLILISSSFTAGFAYASTSKPLVPEFTLKVAENPYYVAPTNWTDPYTGNTTILYPGYQATNRSIEVTIKNQPFTSTIDSTGNYTSLYYNIRVKGHFTNQWSYYPENRNFGYTNASNSDYTNVSFNLEDAPFGTVTAGGQVDFQVQALIGHDNKFSWNVLGHPEFSYYEFAGETSDWSDTQTVTVGEGAPSASPDPSSPLQSLSPSQNPSPDASLSQSDAKTAGWWGLDWSLAVLVGVVGVLLVLAAAMLLRKRNAGQNR